MYFFSFVSPIRSIGSTRSLATDIYTTCMHARVCFVCLFVCVLTFYRSHIESALTLSLLERIHARMAMVNAYASINPQFLLCSKWTVECTYTTYMCVLCVRDSMLVLSNAERECFFSLSWWSECGKGILILAERQHTIIAICTNNWNSNSYWNFNMDLNFCGKNCAMRLEASGEENICIGTLFKCTLMMCPIST